MSVVQRCPNCGTTRATPGECEACHEAQVQYFCTSHSPGLWLDGSTCPKCGARFGDPPRPLPPPAPATSIATPRRAAVRAPEARPVPYLRASPSGVGGGRRDGVPWSGDAGLAASPAALLQKMLLAALRSRHVPARAARAREAPPLVRRARGILRRLLFAALFLFIALAVAFFVLGRALLQGY